MWRFICWQLGQDLWHHSWITIHSFLTYNFIFSSFLKKRKSWGLHAFQCYIVLMIHVQNLGGKGRFDIVLLNSDLSITHDIHDLNFYQWKKNVPDSSISLNEHWYVNLLNLFISVHPVFRWSRLQTISSSSEDSNVDSYN